METVVFMMEATALLKGGKDMIRRFIVALAVLVGAFGGRFAHAGFGIGIDGGYTFVNGGGFDHAQKAIVAGVKDAYDSAQADPTAVGGHYDKGATGQLGNLAEGGLTISYDWGSAWSWGLRAMTGSGSSKTHAGYTVSTMTSESSYSVSDDYTYSSMGVLVGPAFSTDLSDILSFRFAIRAGLATMALEEKYNMVSSGGVTSYASAYDITWSGNNVAVESVAGIAVRFTPQLSLGVNLVLRRIQFAQLSGDKDVDIDKNGKIEKNGADILKGDHYGNGAEISVDTGGVAAQVALTYHL